MSTPAVQSDCVSAMQPRWRGVAVWACTALLLLAGGYLGLKGQHELWDITEPIRFQYDVRNAYNQGARAQQVGVFNMYRHVAENGYERSDGSIDYNLDYPSLRLTMAWAWGMVGRPGTSALPPPGRILGSSTGRCWPEPACCWR